VRKIDIFQQGKSPIVGNLRHQNPFRRYLETVLGEVPQDYSRQVGMTAVNVPNCRELRIRAQTIDVA
jgi:hypothetical protein